MALQSKLFRGDPKLEAAAQLDAAHIMPGSRGPHVGKIQQALTELDGATLARDEIYGPATAAAVLSYKQKRNIINRAYQTQADNIVGKMTIASLDSEMLARENGPAPVPPSPPFPPEPPEPPPHPILNFAMTDPSIYVTVEGSVTPGTAPSRKAIDPGSFLGSGKTRWIDLPQISGKTARLKVEKKGAIFWVVAFVPDGTIVSHKLHVFFHPTPVQVYPDKPGGKPVAHIIADDRNYDSWGSDWKDLAQRYLNITAPQLGAARKFPLLIAMMRNAAANHPTAANDVFADRPLDTLYEILTVVRDKVINPPADAPALPLSMNHVEIGSTSFSSGIAYHANFYNRISTHGSYLEAIDLDSTYIRSAHADISPQKGGPTIKRHTQKESLPSTLTEVHFPPSRWDGNASNAPTGADKIAVPPPTGHVHHLIMDYTYHGAMKNSRLAP
ncbi:hypothetical protein C5L14_05890 [Labrys okinawensis]|uniref:Peptidoglycan binding-like domain-containing protein n=1 Tax=Labrys okinawensis TaxID=346911 RepID=A0A2S9QHB8_9HYPH|nr:peptidoglycan-binding domain-containing protein [Labrys okinawensis]PRH88751.1 hypothetical protein C5L14_05890 [Labrys okinawensis]